MTTLKDLIHSMAVEALHEGKKFANIGASIGHEDPNHITTLEENFVDELVDENIQIIKERLIGD